MVQLFKRYYIKSTDSFAPVPFYVMSHSRTFEEVTWTVHKEYAKSSRFEGFMRHILHKLKENEFHVCLVCRYWWFGWHEKEV